MISSALCLKLGITYICGALGYWAGLLMQPSTSIVPPKQGPVICGLLNPLTLERGVWGLVITGCPGQPRAPIRIRCCRVSKVFFPWAPSTGLKPGAQWIPTTHHSTNRAHRTDPTRVKQMPMAVAPRKPCCDHFHARRRAAPKQIARAPKLLKSSLRLRVDPNTTKYRPQGSS